MSFYLKDAKNVLAEMKSSEHGLSAAEAEKRLAENGKNKLKEPEKESLFKKLIGAVRLFPVAADDLLEFFRCAKT